MNSTGFCSWLILLWSMVVLIQNVSILKNVALFYCLGTKTELTLIGGGCCLLGLCTCIISVRAVAPRIALGIKPDLSFIEDNMNLNIEASWHAVQPLHALIKF